MTKELEFTTLQARWRTAAEKEAAYRETLRDKYRTIYTYDWTKAERARHAGYDAKESATSEALFRFLDAHSPRDWRCGAPVSYIRERLTYADAVTAGQLAVVPPCSYGRLPQDMVRFAWPVPGGGR